MKRKGIRDLPNELLDKIADQVASPHNRKGYIPGVISKWGVNKLAKQYGGVAKIPTHENTKRGWEREALFYAVFPGRFDLRKEMIGPEEVYRKYNPYKLPPTYDHVNSAWNEVGDSTEDLVEQMDDVYRDIHIDELKEKEAMAIQAFMRQSKKRKPFYSL